MPSKKTTPPSDDQTAARAPAKKAAKKAAAKKVTAKKTPAQKTAAAAPAATPAAPAPQPVLPLSREQIAHAAYLNYRSRVEKGIHGDSTGDWLDAERKLKRK